MTWEIALGIFALVAFVISIGAIIAKASQVIAELKAAVVMLVEQLKDSKADREKLHDKLEDHEKRIQTIEIKIDNDPKN
jgi:predicted amino acid-binding ACT domain protein